jgi:hypothetical protein
VYAIEACPALEAAWSHAVQLVPGVEPWRSQCRVGSAAGLVPPLAHQAVALQEPVDRPQCRQRLDPELLELPLDSQRSMLGILGWDEPLAYLTHRSRHLHGKLGNDLMRGTGVVLGPGWIRRIVTAEPRVEPIARPSQGLTDAACNPSVTGGYT